MARKFEEKYSALVCVDLPKKRLKSVENRGGYLFMDEKKSDPWVGKKPHAPNGFVEKYCKEH